jgi:hypothetical protein
MAKFAEGTTVSPDTSMLEIKKLLTKYGASKFVYGEQEGSHVIMFEMRNRRIRLTLPIPDAKQFRTTASYRTRTTDQAKAAQEAEVRRLWRALVLVIKGKMELVESGIVSFEDEFLSYTLTPDNQTFGEWIGPKLDEIYRTGQLPPLLPAPR